MNQTSGPLKDAAVALGLFETIVVDVKGDGRIFEGCLSVQFTPIADYVALFL